MSNETFDFPQLPPEKMLTVERTEPVVSYDVELGDYLKPGSILDYDRDALVATMESFGMTPEHQNSTHIIIEPPNLLVGGYYSPDDEKIVVKYSKNPQQFKRRLQHELKHRSEDTKDKPTKTNLPYTIGSYLAGVGSIATTLSLGTAVGLIYANEFYSSKLGIPIVPRETLASTEQIVLYVQMGTVALSALYWMHPSERRARRAEEYPLPTVFTMKPHVAKRIIDN